MKIKCKPCGVELNPQAKFCWSCGKTEFESVESDADKLKSAPVQMNMEQLSEFGITLINSMVDKLGLTKVDRKHFALPGMTDLQVDEISKMNAREKTGLLVKAVLGQNREAIEKIYANDLIVQKALSEGTASAGGYLVPTEFAQEIIKGLEKPGSVRDLVTVQSAMSDAGEQPKLASAVTVYWGTENTAWTASDPTFGQFTWTIRILTGLNKSSRQLFDDAPQRVGDFLLQLFREAFLREERNVFINGTGTLQPTGLKNASGLTNYSQAGLNLVPDDINAIYHSLPSQYRANATWVMNDSIVEAIGNFKDDQGRYMFPGILSDSGIRSLKGRPIVENEYSANSQIWFGDFKFGYLLKDREQIGFEISTVAGDNTGGAFTSHQVWTKMWERIDGNVQLGEAIVKCVNVVLS